MQVRLVFIILMLSIVSQAYGQGLIAAKRNFFTFRNARMTVGLSISGNWTNESGENSLNFSGNNLPEDYEVTFKADDFPFTNVGVYFDLFSPNSILGLTFGAEYNFQEFSIENETSSFVSSFEINRIQIPAYLKFQTGGVYDELSGIIMGGAYYAFPVGYTRNTSGVPTVENTDELNSGLNLSTVFGFQYRFVDGSSGRTSAETDENIRTWIFLRIDMPISNTFSEGTLNSILASSNAGEESRIRPVNITLGASFYFGSKR